MVDTNRLKGLIKGKGMTQAECAQRIGMSVQSLNAKINGKTEFNSEQIIALRNALDIKGHIEEIFFIHKVD